MAMKCVICGFVNTQDARFCQVCGAVVASSNQYQPYEFQPKQGSKPTVQESPLPAYNEGAMREACLIDSVTLIIVSICGMVFSVLAIGELADRYSEARSLLLSLSANAFVALVVGAGMVAYLLSKEPASSRPKGEVEAPATNGFFVGGIELSPFRSAVRRSPKRSTVPYVKPNAWVRALLYLLAVLLPAVGLTVGAGLLVNAEKGYKRVGKTCIEIGTVVLLLATLIVAAIYFVIATEP